MKGTETLSIDEIRRLRQRTDEALADAKAKYEEIKATDPADANAEVVMAMVQQLVVAFGEALSAREADLVADQSNADAPKEAAATTIRPQPPED